MRILRLLRWAIGITAAWAAGLSAATTILVVFPGVDGPELANGPFPQPPLAIATRALTIPKGEIIVSATISGSWGSDAQRKSTAGVDVLANGILVAQCVKPDPVCWSETGGVLLWSHAFTDTELSFLNTGSVTLTAVQTSDVAIRMATTTLVVTTAPPPTVPTLSPPALLALLLAVVAAGALVFRRRAA